MHIRCEQCGARYELDLPGGAVDGPARRFKFRCSSCGESFVVLTGGGLDAEDAEDESQIRPATGAPARQGMLLKQEGKIYHIADLATLQRWVVERRVLRDDLIGSVDGAWQPVGEHPDLAPFFQVVEKAEHPVVAHAGAPLQPVDDAGELLAEAQRSVKRGAGDTWGGDDDDRNSMLPALDFGAEVGAAGSVIEFDHRIDSTDDPTDSITRPAPSPPSSVLEIAVDDQDDDWPEPPRRSITTPLVVGALVILVGAGGWWLGTQRGQVPVQSVATAPPAKAPPAKAPPAEAPPAEAPPATAPATESPPTEAPPSPETADAAETLQQEAPPPAPVAKAPPRTASAQSLASKGWKAVDSGNLGLAQDYFERSITKTYGTGNAHFGLGYLAEKRGRIDDAQRSYCIARQYVGRDVDLEREIAGRLRVIGRVCP